MIHDVEQVDPLPGTGPLERLEILDHTDLPRWKGALEHGGVQRRAGVT